MYVYMYWSPGSSTIGASSQTLYLSLKLDNKHWYSDENSMWGKLGDKDDEKEVFAQTTDKYTFRYEQLKFSL